MSEFQQIVSALPYEKPFLFVDEIVHLDESGIEGNYRFKEDEYFYQGHFKNYPVTPGVILTECMAQIGLVCLGVYLVKAPLGGLGAHEREGSATPPMDVSSPARLRRGGNHSIDSRTENTLSANTQLGKFIALTESHVNFLKPVFPGEQVRVVSKKKYFRLGKLKCAVEMFNEKRERVCYGFLSGVMVN